PMRQGPIPETPLEVAALAVGRVPTPLLDTIVSLLLARTVLVATKLGIFEALAHGALGTAEVASFCQTQHHATGKLRDALVGARFPRVRGGRYELRPLARTWLLMDSPTSLYDALLYQFVDLRYIEHLEEYVRSGEPVHMHEEMAAGEWGLYQRAMRSGASFTAPEGGRRLPVPSGPRDLLDLRAPPGDCPAAPSRL